MKKIIFFLTMVLVYSSVLYSCAEEGQENKSYVTYYPIVTVSGDDPYLIKQGTTFVDPGVAATENGVSIPVVTTATGDYRGSATLDTNKADRYMVSYTATNVDGFKQTASRTVWVSNKGDLTNSIEGLYLASVTRNGSYLASNASKDMKYILIWKNDDGTYGISDAVGGWYEYGRGFGIGYASQGLKIKIDNISTNSFTFTNPSGGVGAFGGTLTAQSMTVDSATKTIVLKTKWLAPTEYNFVITLVQQ